MDMAFNILSITSTEVYMIQGKTALKDSRVLIQVCNTKIQVVFQFTNSQLGCMDGWYTVSRDVSIFHAAKGHCCSQNTLPILALYQISNCYYIC